MGVTVGIDVGSTSVKLAALGATEDRVALERLASEGGDYRLAQAPPATGGGESTLLVSRYRRVQGQPLKATVGLLAPLVEALGADAISGVRVTGSGGRRTSRLLDVSFENEFKAIAWSVSALTPEVRTVFEMGGENSKYIMLEPAGDGQLSIVDYGANGDCAAGTGSFIDQQASRLRYTVEQVGTIALSSGKSAQIAGRCSVFAKSDMIHAQQKGFTPAAILKGLCEAVARNFKGTIVKGRKIEPQVLFLGGVAWNQGVLRGLEEAFNLKPGDLLVPQLHAWFPALGCALIERQQVNEARPRFEALLGSVSGDSTFDTMPPLSMENVVLQRNQVRPFHFEAEAAPVRTFLGLDVGSVSTNLVAIDERGHLIHEIYTWTRGRPIEVVTAALRDLEQAVGRHVEVCGVGTTGSGRELVAELVGADAVKDEITAHKTGAMHVSLELLDQKVDTIFEIGGQDSKFISMAEGIVVDFTMNEACAAGTGSFLEEQAEKLGVAIKGEFANLALSSERPLRLGERCTVFMEKDVNALKLAGAETSDIAAGLAYSVVLNYLNRVVRGRKIGDVIFFQGGTAYNDSVAAAFAGTLGKRIIVPPHNGVIGAIGAALLARERLELSGAGTRFRGFDLERVHYNIREFTCKGCTNCCDMQEFSVEGAKTFWGDKCSERYRKPARVDREAEIPDLLTLRKEALLAYQSDADAEGPSVGYPRAMYFYESFPFWATYLKELGLRVLPSDETDKRIASRSTETTVAEPCYPIRLAHGHVENCLEKKTDYILMANVLDAEVVDVPTEASFLCPWGQCLPFMVRRAPAFEPYADKFLTPTIHFRRGRDAVKKELFGSMRERLGVSRRQSDRAATAAYEAQESFRLHLKQAGQQALEQLASSQLPGVVLIGRPYNLYDPQMNMNLASKLRRFYGVNVIPMDFLPHEGIAIEDVNDNMFWNYGLKIIQAARFSQHWPCLHVIYITNFKCGPDSYVKQFAAQAAGKPYLTLQFDGHSNDAGMITRCEAYLDSKGLLS